MARKILITLAISVIMLREGTADVVSATPSFASLIAYSAQTSQIILFGKIVEIGDSTKKMDAYSYASISSKVRNYAWYSLEKVIEYKTIQDTSKIIDFFVGNITYGRTTFSFPEKEFMEPLLLKDSSYLLFLSIDPKATYETGKLIFRTVQVVSDKAKDTIETLLGNLAIKQKAPLQFDRIHKTVFNETIAKISLRYFKTKRYAEEIAKLNIINSGVDKILPVGRYLIIPKRDYLNEVLKPKE